MRILGRVCARVWYAVGFETACATTSTAILDVLIQQREGQGECNCKWRDVAKELEVVRLHLCGASGFLFGMVEVEVSPRTSVS